MATTPDANGDKPLTKLTVKELQQRYQMSLVAPRQQPPAPEFKVLLLRMETDLMERLDAPRAQESMATGATGFGGGGWETICQLAPAAHRKSKHRTGHEDSWPATTALVAAFGAMRAMWVFSAPAIAHRCELRDSSHTGAYRRL